MGELGTFLVVVAILIVALNPWLLIVAGVIAVLLIVISIIFSDSGRSEGYTSGAVSYSSGTDSNFEEETKASNGLLWEGRFKMEYDPVIATFRNGYVFEGYDSGIQGFSAIKATYQNGFVYEGSITSYLGSVLGRYENGYIYRGNSTFFSDCIGRYEDGKIYKGTTTSFSSDIIGTYEGDGDGAAAAAIIYLLNG